jgi:hypothetical protein
MLVCGSVRLNVMEHAIEAKCLLEMDAETIIGFPTPRRVEALEWQ